MPIGADEEERALGARACRLIVGPVGLVSAVLEGSRCDLRRLGVNEDYISEEWSRLATCTLKIKGAERPITLVSKRPQRHSRIYQ